MSLVRQRKHRRVVLGRYEPTDPKTRTCASRERREQTVAPHLYELVARRKSPRRRCPLRTGGGTRDGHVRLTGAADIALP